MRQIYVILPLCICSLGQATSSSQAEFKRAGRFHHRLLEMQGRAGSARYKYHCLLWQCGEEESRGRGWGCDLPLSNYADSRDCTCGAVENGHKKGPNQGHKISRLQRLSLLGVAGEAPYLEGKTSQGQHSINKVIMKPFNVLKERCQGCLVWSTERIQPFCPFASAVALVQKHDKTLCT